MRAVIQRVLRASIVVAAHEVASIGPGLLVYVGVQRGDSQSDVEYLLRKLPELRVFDDPNGKMNYSVKEIGGSLLLVSQFTLCADVRNGKRPSFDQAEIPELAKPLFDDLVDRLIQLDIPVSTGIFRADMEVCSVNDGPINILVDSRKTF